MISYAIFVLFLVIRTASPNSQWTLGEFLVHADAYLMKSFNSKVQGGEYVTYTLTSPGSMDLVLHSTRGDADIYVGAKSKPTADDYEVSSVTCHTDAVHISEDLPRPVQISVFGNPYHELSLFTLDAYLVPVESTYERIHEQLDSPSYEDLVDEHVLIRDEHMGDDEREGKSRARGGKEGGSKGSGGGRGGDGRSIDEGESWLDWFLDAEEGHAAIFTVIAAIFKILLQVLG